MSCFQTAPQPQSQGTRCGPFRYLPIDSSLPDNTIIIPHATLKLKIKAIATCIDSTGAKLCTIVRTALVYAPATGLVQKSDQQSGPISTASSQP